jgi:hypothetical protein
MDWRSDRSTAIVPRDNTPERPSKLQVHEWEHECRIAPTSERCDVVGCIRATPKRERPPRPGDYRALSYPEAVELYGRTGRWWGHQ